jgi:hypothetical protein
LKTQNSVSANTIKTKIENTKTVYTSVTKQQLAETKIKFFDITNEEYARAETYKSLALISRSVAFLK